MKPLVSILRVLGTNSLFMSSRLLGNTNFAKRAATQTWFAVQYGPEPCCKPRNFELAHRMRPGGAIKVPVYYLVKLREGISYRSQTSPVALAP